MAAAHCRSNCRACRSSIARGILPAIGVLAFAAISTAWRGSPPCAAMNSSVERRPAAPEPLAADIVRQACPGFARAELPRPSLRPVRGRRAQEKPSQESLTAEDPAHADFVIETSVASPAELPEPTAHETSHPTDLDKAVETPRKLKIRRKFRRKRRRKRRRTSCRSARPAMPNRRR